VDSRVDTFTLLKAALRSRPNYIIVGEIRGAEGNVAFQGMQTGHPVLATFHASAVTKMIQRLTADPINVPVTFIDNLNVAMILSAVYRKGKFLRRCLAVEEIEGYYEEVGGVVTRAVFQWDPETDKHNFRGLNNSFILENKIATKLGYEDKRQIYQDLFLRARILEEMRSRGIEDYYDVLDIIVKFYKHGVDGLPFSV
jgi:flagellar protein FlaI